VAISNHRLVSFSDGQITFRWRDSAHHNEQKLLTLSLDEFLRRFLLHILRSRCLLQTQLRCLGLPTCQFFISVLLIQTELREAVGGRFERGAIQGNRAS
jgi:hypothetical protein